MASGVARPGVRFSDRTPPTEAQAAAWLKTVIPPLLRGLDRVILRLDDGDWERRLPRFAEMVPVPYRPNLEQMLRFGARLRTAADAYDAAHTAFLAKRDAREAATLEIRADQLLDVVLTARDALADRYGLPVVEADG